MGDAARTATAASPSFRLGQAPLALLLATALTTACGERGSPTTPSIAAAGDSLLASNRIAALPPAQRSGWTAYLDASAAGAARDRALVDAEVRAAGLASWIPAPVGPDFTYAGASASWLAGPDARTQAANLMSFQTPTGGWSKAVDVLTRPRQPGEGWASQTAWDWISTFDNGATTEHMRFLGAIAGAQHDSAEIAGFLKGIGFVLAAQFPNGCWPQVYPLEGSYHDAVTYNDDAMAHVLELLAAISRGDYAFVPAATRTRAGDALTSGIGCIVASQVVDRGKRTVWGAQQDPLTLAPVQGRAYEPASLCSLESADVMDFLMQIPTPAGDVVAAVHAAAAWLQGNAIYGYVYQNGVLSARAGAGPLWARFYELGTGRPLFGDRDGTIHYVLSEISLERQQGYAWYTTSPASTLARYTAWAQTHPKP